MPSKLILFNFLPHMTSVLILAKQTWHSEMTKKHKGDKKVVLSSWNNFLLPEPQNALSKEIKRNHQGMD